MQDPAPRPAVKQPRFSRISKAEAAIFTAAFATLLVFLLLSLFLAQRYLIGTAQYWDFLRVERYLQLSQMALESDARAWPSEEALQKLRDIGLYPDVYPPDHEIPQPNPRYVPAIESVEMWGHIRGPEGKPVAVLRLSRHDINTRHTIETVRLYTLVGAVGGTMLIAVIWLALRRTFLRRIRAIIGDMQDQIPQTAKTAAEDPLDYLSGLLKGMVDAHQGSMAQVQKLLRGHSEAACVGTTEGILREVNAAYCRIFSKTPEELVGSNYLDLVPSSDRGEVVANLQRLSSRHPVNIVEHRVVLPDGSRRWMRRRDQAVMDEEGKVVEVLSFGNDITAEKQLEERMTGLRLAFDQMQSLAETGSLTWDFGTDQMEWTDETHHLLGVKQSESTPSLHNLLRAVEPADRESVRTLFELARSNGNPFEHEFRVVTADGTHRSLQCRAEVRADPKTKLLTRLTCTLRDITTLRAAESAMLRELRLREAIEQSLAAGIVVSDNQGRNLLVNPAFCEMTGWSSEELVGATAPYPYWPEEEIPNIRRAFESALAGQTPPQGYELKFCRKDGTRFDVLIKVAPLLDSEDKHLGWLGAVTDISALQKIRRELQQAESSARQELIYRKAVEQSLDVGIVLRDMSGKTQSVNPAFVRMVGFSEEELLTAQPPNEPYWPEEEKTNITKALSEALAGRPKPGGFQMIFQRKDGTRFDVLVKVAPLLDGSGEQLGWLGAVSDVSAIQQTRRDLAKAESAVRAELQYRQAVEKAITVGLIAIGKDGLPISVNETYCRMFGYTEQEIMAMGPTYPLWPEEEQAKIEQAFERHLAGESPPEGFSLRFKKKDGSPIDVLIRSSTLHNAHGETIGVLSALTDVSELQATQRRLQETNERLQIAQDVAEFGIWDWDPIKDTLHWDRQSFAIFGHPEATNAEQVWRQAHSEEDQERLTYELRRLIAARGKSGQDRIRARWPDGTIHDILSTYVVLYDDAGRVTRVIGINRDVTSELEEERELRDANERLAAALEGDEFGTFEHIVGIGDINWSPANYEINGIDPSVTDPAKLFELWKQCTGSFFQELMARMSALPVDENHLTYEFTAYPPGREPRCIRVSVYIERSNQGHPVRLVGVTRRID